MILQTIKKGVRNDTFEESQVIQCFDVIIEKDMLQISNAESSDEELEIRQKNFNKAKELIGAAGLCRDNIIWYLGDPDRKSTRLNSSHRSQSRMPSSA